MANSHGLPNALFDALPWNPDPQAVWLGSSLTLRRNLGRYNFPSKLAEGDAHQVLEAVKGTLMPLPEMANAHFFKLDEVTATSRELIFEHFLFLHGLQQPPGPSGLILNEGADALALINASDHLQLQALSPTPKWDAMWQKLNMMETQLSSALGFAYLPKFGYLTSDPALSGTGLTVQIFLHLPALIHAGQFEGALANAQDADVHFMGFSGTLDGLVADLLIIQNNFSLGVSEEAIFHSMQMAATKLIGAEKTMRQHLKEEQNSEIKDIVSKAFGLTVHAFQLETQESLDLLSLLKLGLALDYITNIEGRKLDELFFKCRRGYFSHLYPEIQDPKELAKKRAEFLKNELKGISLKG